MVMDKLIFYFSLEKTYNEQMVSMFDVRCSMVNSRCFVLIQKSLLYLSCMYLSVRCTPVPGAVDGAFASCGSFRLQQIKFCALM